MNDCVDGAKALILAGQVDPERCAIRAAPPEAHVLGALAFDTFRGTSLYGVTDLEA